MRRLLLSAAVLLAACGSKPASNQTNAPEPVGATNETAPANSTANQVSANAALNETESDGGLGRLPPADSALRFVGTWAASKAECATKPWRFAADALTVEGGPHCSFYKVTKAPGGYDIAAQCPTKEPIHTDLINVRFAESARAMLVESNAIKPIGLIYCGK